MNRRRGAAPADAPRDNVVRQPAYVPSVSIPVSTASADSRLGCLANWIGLRRGAPAQERHDSAVAHYRKQARGGVHGRDVPLYAGMLWPPKRTWARELWLTRAGDVASPIGCAVRRERLGGLRSASQREAA
jgi:hypothetical protein